MSLSNDIPRAAVPDPNTQRRRQIIILVLGLLGLLGVAGALIMMQDRQPSARQLAKEEVKKNFVASGKALSDEEVWVAQSTKEIQAMKTENNELRRDIEMLKRQIEMSGGQQRNEALLVPPPPLPPVQGIADRDAMKVPPGGLPPPAPGAKQAIKDGFSELVDIDPNKNKPGLIQRIADAGGTTSVAQSPDADAQTTQIYRVEIDLQVKQDGAAVGDTSGRVERKDRTHDASAETYLPAGSFVRGVLLSGVDAPAGNQSQNNPHPVLIRLKDMATLPNRFRSNVKECFVVGAAYGDISSERAYIRTETLSCIQNDGQVIEAKVSGYVTGEDGKTGMRGRLVTKEGQLLAKALLAGVLSGIGKGLSESYKTTSVSALGTTTTTDPDKIAETGIAQGTASAMDRLSKYYTDMAEKTFPIVEIDANRQVEVVFTRGVTLEGTLKNMKRRW